MRISTGANQSVFSKQSPLGEGLHDCIYHFFFLKKIASTTFFFEKDCIYQFFYKASTSTYRLEVNSFHCPDEYSVFFLLDSTAGVRILKSFSPVINQLDILDVPINILALLLVSE